MSPEELIARARASLGRDPGAPTPRPPSPPPAWGRFVAALGAAELATAFVAAARAVGAEVVEVAPGEVEGAVADVLAAAGATRVAYAADCGLAAAGQGLGLDSFALDAGVTGVTAAVARSGALLLDSGAGRPGALSALPPLHVAVVRVEQLVGSLAETLALPRPNGSSGRVLITGPSKTADIEGVLITGVHGPGRVVVMLVGARFG